MSIQDNPLKLNLFLMDGDAPNFPEANCFGENIDPDMWFDPEAEREKQAKQACRKCPYGPPSVLNDWEGDDTCFKWAMQVEEQLGYFAYGVYGARDAADRQRLLDAKRIRKGMGIEEPDDDE